MKKQQSYTLISVILILLSLGIYLVSNKSSTIRRTSDYFAVKDTSDVNLIKIEGMKAVELHRQGNNWFIQDSLLADPVAVNNFLFLFNRLKIKSIVSKTDLVNIEPVYTLHIGTLRKKRSVRYYINNGEDVLQRENSSRFFPVEVSGFPELRVSDVISDSPYFWRNRLLVSLKPQEIAVVRVRYPGMKEKDFTLFIRDDSVLMHDPVNNFFYPGERVHVEKLRMFTSYFMNIYFEDFVTDPGTRDSVLLSIPDMQVIIDVNDGDPVEFDIFPCYTHGRRDDRYIYIRKNKDPEILIGKHIITDLWGKWKEDFIRN